MAVSQLGCLDMSAIVKELELERSNSVRQPCYGNIYCHEESLPVWIFFTVLITKCRLLTGSIVGIVIRYGLDAEKSLYILNCWPNQTNPNQSLPSSVVLLYNNTDYYEYTHGRNVHHSYVAQPQFEDKVLFFS